MAPGASPARRADSAIILRTIIDRAPVALLVANARGVITIASRRLEQLFGYEAGELAGESVERLVPAAARPQHRRQRAAFQARGVPSVIGALRELYGVSKTGALVPVEIYLAPVVVAGVPLVIASVTDLRERRRLEEAVATAASQERRRLGAELHDDLGQQLTGIAMLVQGVAMSARAQRGESLGRELEHVRELVAQALQTCRSVAADLVPAGLPDGDIDGALRRLAAALSSSGSVPVRFRSRGGRGLLCGEHVATQLYRIAQEASANALKHARPSSVVIELVRHKRLTRLMISDDGHGMPPDPRPQGLGLRLMKYRAGVIGGVLRIERPTRGGTRVSCLLHQPLASETRMRPSP